MFYKSEKNFTQISYVHAVYKEYMEGKFVVKRLSGDYNRISVDKAEEYVNKTAKDAVVII